MAFVEDTAVFFSDADFAEQVTVDGVARAAIFDMAYALAQAGMGMESTQPALTLPTLQVPASPRGKPCVVRSVAYTIAEHHPDGTGVSLLLLEKA